MAAEKKAVSIATPNKQGTFKATKSAVHRFRKEEGLLEEFTVSAGDIISGKLPDALVASLVKAGLATEVIDFDPNTSSTL